MTCDDNNNIECYRGDTHTLHLTFSANDVPLDLTGKTVYFTVKRELTDTDEEAIIAKTVSSFVDPTDGEVNIELTSEDTTPAGDYWYDIQLRYTGGSIVSSKRGRFIINQDVTLRIS